VRVLPYREGGHLLKTFGVTSLFTRSTGKSARRRHGTSAGRPWRALATWSGETVSCDGTFGRAPLGHCLIADVRVFVDTELVSARPWIVRGEPWPFPSSRAKRGGPDGTRNTWRTQMERGQPGRPERPERDPGRPEASHSL